MEIERYGEEQPLRDETDIMVLAMPLKQAERLIDLPDMFACEALSESESTPTWACMMTIDVGSEMETLPDLYTPEHASIIEQICFDHRKPGRACPLGVVSLVAYAQADWAAVHRDQSCEAVLEAMSSSTRAVLDRLLGFKLGDRAILDARIHRWGLARPIGLLPFTHKYNHDRGIGLCSDGMGGSDAESAFLSGSALADAITASHPR